MKKLRIISMLCTIAMLIGCFAMFPAAAADESVVAATPTTLDAEGNGKGTEDEPYLIYQSNFADYYTNYSKKGYYSKHVKMMEDITVNEGKASEWAAGTNRPATKAAVGGYWTGPMGDPAAHAEQVLSGSFDGNGHTISGVCLIGSGVRRIALFAGVASGATLKNLRLTNSYFEMNSTTGYDELASFASRFDGTISNCYSDAILVNKNTGNDSTATGGIVGTVRNATNAKIENCVFAGSIKQNNSSVNANGRVGGILGYTIQANTTIKNCLFAGTINAAIHVGGIIGHAAAATTVEGCMSIIKSGALTSSTATVSDFYAGGVNGSVVVNSMYVLKNYRSSNQFVASGQSISGAAGTWPNIKELTVDDLKNAETVTSKLPGWTFKSESYIPNPTTLKGTDIKWTSVFKYWTVGDGGGASGAWYNLDNNNFVSFWETNKGNNNYSFNGSFILIDDITVNTGKSSDWATNRDGVTVFSSTIKTLNGTFDGNGHTISGLCVYNNIDDSTNRFIAMFAVVSGTVKNLTIENSYIYNNNNQGYDGTGAIAGRLSGSIINCHVGSDVIVEHNGNTNPGTSGVGGLAGDARNSTPKVIDSTFAGVVKSPKIYVGGILGITSNNTTISNCISSATITSAAYTGGIVGYTTAATTVSNCVNNGNITASANVGGILGYNSNAGTVVTYCINNGTVTSNVGSVAGIVGSGNQKVAISNCVNTGTITSNGDDTMNSHRRPGGILGHSGAVGTTITDCLNTGAVVHTAGNKLSGGILGNVGNNGKSGNEAVIYTVTVKDCLNLSNNVQSGNLYAGGHGSWVVVNSFYRVKGLGINYYGSGADLATVTNATSGQWKNIKEITLAEFLNGTYLSGWVREDGYLPVPTATAKIDLINYVNANTLGLDSTGAVHSIRISPEHPGLRFETKVDAAAIEALKDMGYTVEMNTYITLAKFISDTEFTADALEKNGKKYLTVNATEYLRTVDNDGYTAFAGSVVNVNDLTRYYAGIGCITLTINGQSYDIYAKYNNEENASVSGIALVAARDTKTTAATGYANQITDIYGNTVYSPYTQAQYNSLKPLMVDTPETAILNYAKSGKTSYTASFTKSSNNNVAQSVPATVYADWSKWAAQGGCVVGDYLYTVMWTNNDDGNTNPNLCVIVKTKLSDGSVVAKSAALSLGHGNDLTFNGTDLVAVSCDSSKKVFFINPETLALDESKTKTLGVTPVSIDYDTVNNKYVVVDVQNVYVYIYNTDFTLERVISGAGMTKGVVGKAIPDGSYSMQGVMTDGTYVYILGWHGGDTWAEKGSMSTLEHFFTDGVKSSIRVVDLASGAFVQDIDLGIEREVEFVDYENGKFYIGCNNNLWTGMEFYTGTIA